MAGLIGQIKEIIGGTFGLTDNKPEEFEGNLYILIEI